MNIRRKPIKRCLNSVFLFLIKKEDFIIGFGSNNKDIMKRVNKREEKKREEKKRVTKPSVSKENNMSIRDVGMNEIVNIKDRVIDMFRKESITKVWMISIIEDFERKWDRCLPILREIIKTVNLFLTNIWSKET